MQEINSIVLTGEVVSDAAFGHTVRGSGVATFTLVFFSGQPGGGLKKGYVDIVFMGDQAKKFAGMARRSEKLKVEGRLQQRSWKTPEGFHKSKLEIVAHQIEPFTADGVPASANRNGEEFF